MRRIAPALLLALAIGGGGGCSGCRRNTSVDAAPRDAGAEAGSTSASPPPWKAHLAARLLGAAQNMTRLDDGALALSGGLFVHLIRPDGSIGMVGTPAAYAPFITESQEDIGGYDAPTRRDLMLSGSSTRLFARTLDAEPTTFLWNGREWAKTTEIAPLATPPLLAFQPVFGGDEPDASALPPTHSWLTHVTFADGRHAWLGDATTGQELYVEDKAGGGTVVPLPKQPDVTFERCAFLESADDHAYAHCTGYHGQGPATSTLSRLEGTTWRDVPLPREDGADVAPKAVDSSGAIWLTVTSDMPKVVRRTRDGKSETIALPKDAAERTPFYSSYSDALLAVKGKSAHGAMKPFVEVGEDLDQGQLRSWTNTTIVKDPPARDHVSIQQIVPRRSGDVWIHVHDQRALLLYRVAQDGREHPTVLVRSATDEHVVIRNERPLRTWVGHCNHIFVTLASAAKGEPLSSAAILERRAEIDAIAAKLRRSEGPSAQPYLVAGHLADREVIGVVFLRGDPETSEPAMEAAATALIERFTTDPASPPTATCTLPILEQLFDAAPR